VLGRNYVISIQEEAGDPSSRCVVASVTRRAGSAAPAPTTWLTALLDLVVDPSIFRVTDLDGERIETLDELVTKEERGDVMQQIHTLSGRHLSAQVDLPLREVVSTLRHSESS